MVRDIKGRRWLEPIEGERKSLKIGGKGEQNQLFFLLNQTKLRSLSNLSRHALRTCFFYYKLVCCNQIEYGVATMRKFEPVFVSVIAFCICICPCCLFPGIYKLVCCLPIWIDIATICKGKQPTAENIRPVKMPQNTIFRGKSTWNR